MIQDPIVDLGIVQEKLTEARKTISEQQELIETQKKQIEALKERIEIYDRYAYMDAN